MINLRVVLEITLILLPLGILLSLTVPKFRSVLEPRRTIQLSLVLLSFACVAFVAECVTERRFPIYGGVMVIGMAGLVAVRASRYLKTRK